MRVPKNKCTYYGNHDYCSRILDRPSDHDYCSRIHERPSGKQNTETC